jgi:hypothetical protein
VRFRVRSGLDSEGLHVSRTLPLDPYERSSHERLVRSERCQFLTLPASAEDCGLALAN